MLNPDSLVERAKLKSQVTSWRALTFIALIIAAFFMFGGKEGLSGIKAIEKPYIARINITDIIYEDQDRLDILKEIAEDDKIKAVIMRINSPGGTAVGGEGLYKAIKKLNEKKPVIAVMDSVAASAAYLISLGAEHVFAQNGTITGSIGVIMEVPNLKDMADKIGLRFDYVKTSPLKGSPTLFEPKNEAAFAVLNEMMMDFYNYFVGVVATERRMEFAEAAKLADGRVFSGKAAVVSNLVDAIGDETDAVEWLGKNKKISKSLEVKEVDLSKPKEPFEQFLGSLSENLGIKDLATKIFNFKGLLL